jgi:hypothetical protein
MPGRQRHSARRRSTSRGARQETSSERVEPKSELPNDQEGGRRQSNGESNVTVALRVLHSLGGAERFVDIEAVAAEAFALAPDRFGWRTRPWASWERVRTAFVHANQEARRRGQAELVLSSRDGDAWRLTAAGVALVRATATRSHAEGRSVAPIRRGSLKSSERVRQIRRHPAFARFTNGTPVSDIERFMVADLLLCPPDSALPAVKRKVDAAKAAALDAADDEVLTFLSQVELEVDRSWS